MSEESGEQRLHDEDAILVKEFQAGEKAAFDRLVMHHKDRLFNICYWMLGDYQEANDTSQDIFIKAYRGLGGFRFQSTFFTWLYRIAVNTCKNKLSSLEHRQQKKMVRLDNPGANDNAETTMAIEDETQSPVRQLEKKERATLLKKAIDALPSDQKTVVVLRDIQGLAYEEIAVVTGFNLGSVKSKLSRARLGLKERLKGA